MAKLSSLVKKLAVLLRKILDEDNESHYASRKQPAILKITRNQNYF